MNRRKKSWVELVANISSTFRKWNITTYEIMPLKPPARRDRYHTYEERTVTVRWWLGGKWIELTNKTEPVAHDNLALLALTIEQMYMHKVSAIDALMVSAYRQLYPPPTVAPEPSKIKIDESDPYAVIGVERHYPLPVIELIWKAKLRVEHPDVGGKAEVATKLNAAMADIRKRRAS